MGSIKTTNLAVWSYIWLRWKHVFGVNNKARLQYFLSYEGKDEAHAIALAKNLGGLEVEIYKTGVFRKKWHVWAASKDVIEVTHDSFEALLRNLTRQARSHDCQLVGYSARFKGAV